jgi:hypothetical protein
MRPRIGWGERADESIYLRGGVGPVDLAVIGDSSAPICGSRLILWFALISGYISSDSFGENLALNIVQLIVEIPDSVIRADRQSLLVQYVACVQARRNDVYRDRRLGFVIYDSPVNICASPIFWKWGIVYIHEQAAAQNPTGQDPIIGRDDGAIRSALDNRPLDTFKAEIGKYWHFEGAGAFDDFIGRRLGVPDETGDPESYCQRFQGAHGGGTHPD